MTRDYMGRDEFFAEATAALAEDDWRDDPSRDERWNAGVDFVMNQLCDFLSVDPKTVNWDAATETLDGDVQSVIGNILRKHFGEYWGPGVHPPLDAAPDRLTVEQAWTILCETPDITSPEEYPDHALITIEQLESFMGRAAPASAEEPAAWKDVLTERRRQVEAEGWTPEHDDTHTSGEMARAAASYCESAARPKLFARKPDAAFAVPMSWPLQWDRRTWWKPTCPRRDLIKAGALILAEIERLDRLPITTDT